MTDPELDKIKQDAATLFDGGKSPEDIMKFLRESGCSQGLSMFLLPQVIKCTMAEAKRLVFFSPTWADQRSSTEQLHDKIEDDLLGEEKGKKEDSH